MRKMMIMISLALFLALTGCGQENSNEDPVLLENPIQKTEIVMGTAVSLRIYDEGKEELMEEAFDRLRELSDMADVNVIDSEVYEINKNAGIAPVKVSEEIFTLVKRGVEYAEDTNGLFDISIGPLTSLWNIGFDDARKPSQEEIDEVLLLIGHDKIELNEEEQTVFLTKEGMRLDLGAIAKGYFADLVADLLEDNGVTSAIVDLGG